MNPYQFRKLSQKYGPYASWAIWNEADQADPTIIHSHLQDLNARHVFIAYNVSGHYVRPGPWANFRGGKHDRKLKYACNDTPLRGSYLTDLFKNLIEVKANKVDSRLTAQVVEENVIFFLNEISDVGATMETVFVVLGAAAGKQFRKHFLNHLGDVKVIYTTHYSYYGWTDKKWVEDLWKRLGIKASFEAVKRKYR